MKRFSPITLTMLALTALILLSACRPTADLPPASTAGSSPEVAPRSPGTELQSGAFDLPQPASGLDGFSSYQARLVVQFEGMEGAQAVEWSRTYLMRVARTGESFRQLDLETSPAGAAGESTRRTMAEANGYQYEKVDQEACAVLPADQATALAEQWEPASLLLGFSGGAPAGEESIENLAARRYTFDQGALGQSDLTQSTGEVWVAAGSDVVLRYTLTQQGGEDYFGEGVSGTLSWTYEVTQVNQPQQLSLPEDCRQPAGLDLPLPVDASQVNQADGYLNFKTALVEPALLDFYRPILESAGWQLVENMDPGEFDLSDFNMDDFDLSELDASDFDFSDLEGGEFGEELSGGASDTAQGSYRFSRGEETLTLILVPDGELNEIHLFLSTSQETVPE
ncbi:MAG: hypothetical protein JW862_07085 [Anaerolineales bacterium]|nr:hypothetical protein [Anaerolineales bacterium]